MEQLSHYKNIPADANLDKFRGKSKYRSKCISNIAEHINNLKYSTSSELNMLDKVRVGSKKLNNVNAYSTKDAIEAMIKYSDDAIINNN